MTIMETAHSNQMPTNLVLTDLLNIIDNFGTQDEVYISQAKIFSVEIELSSICTQRNDISVKLLENLGIDRLASQSSIEILAQSVPALDKTNSAISRWHDLKQDMSLVENLKELFKNNQIIPFSNWADVENSSDLWYGLLSDVIKPLKRKDFNFIFYLGDSTRRLFFEVDEILDIIAEFSFYGQVTFALDEQEAASLWALLNGKKSEDTFFDLDTLSTRRKCLSLFNSLDINNLVIYSQKCAMLFGNETQYEITRRGSDRAIAQQAERDSFVVGYCLGLSHMLDIPQCLGLGIIVCGAYVESGTVPDKQMLVEYTKKWISETEFS